MIFLDVTSSCKSPMNTGVQRVVRELFRSLAAVAPVTPLIWDPGLRSYCTLSRRERVFLERPFAAGTAPDAEPDRRANPVPVWSKLARRLTHRFHRLDLPAALTPADTLFVPEIFQDNRVGFLAGLSGHTAARRVALCHDLITLRRPEFSTPTRAAGFAPYADALAAFDRVLAVSRETRDDLQAHWRAAGLENVPPVSVHPLPVNHAGTPRPPIRPPSGASRPLVLCVGTFERRKNHLVLLEAAGRVWARGVDFELVLVGRTTAHWGARVLAAIQTLLTAGRPVRWLRHVDDRTLRETYERCVFTVFPTLAEGFGLPILESLWHGRPCLCGTNGALGEISGGGGCLPVDQTDPAALAAAIELLLKDPALRQQLSGQAAHRHFDTWESLIQTLLPLLAPSNATGKPARLDLFRHAPLNTLFILLLFAFSCGFAA